MSNFWVLLTGVKDQVRTFMNPLIEAFESEPVVELHLIEPPVPDNLISSMPVDTRPTFADPDYNAEEWGSPEDAREALSNVAYTETDPTPVNAVYNPEPVSEPVIDLVEGGSRHLVSKRGRYQPRCLRTGTIRWRTLTS